MNPALQSTPPWVDLHLHSTRSDGSLNPDELIRHARDIGIRFIAITDHDTVEGFSEGHEFLIRNKIKDLDLISGIEISARIERGTLHILGYGIDTHHALLQSSISDLRSNRRNRNLEITNRLASLNIVIDLEELTANRLELENIGRPHFARLLMKKNIVQSITQAFDEFLGKEKAAYVPMQHFSAEKIIDMIHTIGGKAFLAHPVSLNLDETSFEQYFKQLKEIGLDGLEVYASVHSLKQIHFYSKISQKYNMMVSAGSDFHGSYKPGIRMGSCFMGNMVGIESISKDLVLK